MLNFEILILQSVRLLPLQRPFKYTFCVGFVVGVPMTVINDPSIGRIST